ncbi:hypothetical protein OSB04_026424 [Centaurea solstitialis]|uniref:FAS1 domain-containing protein n=1 Tax=Centaurea solstitialis TaxID=347529 RepID=A0AA38SWX8_9ASTR|nr:hypothetical protein OSB04_026424 [Centaurea solstitialis]
MPCESIMDHPATQIISKSTVFPATKSALSDLKLSVSDLPMLSCHYIQKGNLFPQPPIPISDLIPLLEDGLSQALTHFPPLAGRLTTDSNGYIYITCNDAGAHFVHANATHLTIDDILSPTHVPDSVKSFFALDRTVSHDGHFNPLLAVQVTELNDGVFVGFSVNHAVVDGTSLWNFINTFAEGRRIRSRKTGFRPGIGVDLAGDFESSRRRFQVTFDEHAPLCERVFSFNRESILKLKEKTNNKKKFGCYNNGINGEVNAVEVMGKQSNDPINEKVTALIGNWIRNAVVSKPEISSFQSLCALLWRGVTRARKFPASKTTTFRMAVNCRHRLEPKLEPMYFGNAIQSIPTYATAGDVLSHDLRWCAEQLNKNVLSHDDTMVRRAVENWEKDPRCFPLGNFDGAMLTMGSSPRFPMFDNDFGWGRPVAVRSGGRISSMGRYRRFRGGMAAGVWIWRCCFRRKQWRNWKWTMSSCSTFRGNMKRVRSSRSPIVFLVVFVSISCLLVLILSVLRLPDASSSSNDAAIEHKKIKKVAKNSDRIGKFGEMMTEMLPQDLSFTIFMPSETAFERDLRLWVNESLVGEKANDTYAILSRVLGFTVVPWKILSESVPYGEEINCDSLSGLELDISKDRNEMLIVNRVRSKRVDLRKGEMVIHVMDGVIMEADFEQSVRPDDDDDDKD